MSIRPSGNLAPWHSAPHLRQLAACALAAALLIVAYIAPLLLPPPAEHAINWAMWVPASLSLAIGLYYGAQAAWAALAARTFDIDVLMVLGAVAAAALGEPREGALLLFLFVLSGALEDMAEARTKREITALAALMPARAERFTGSDDPSTASEHQWQPIAPADLAPTDIVRIRKGESIPADGTSLSTDGFVDEATLTGEPMPRHIKLNSSLSSGTINAGDMLIMQVTRPAADSALQRIIAMVTSAQAQRQPIEQMIDRLSQPYSLAVLGSSIIVLLLWRFALDRTWHESIFTAITLLIVASPCALIIATPTASLAAIARSARGGVLFKGGQAIMRLATIRCCAMDKTGTLTAGTPRLLAITALGDCDEHELLAAAAAIEAHSTHPIATAIIAAAKDLPANLNAASPTTPPVASDVRTTIGGGIQGTIAGKTYLIGSPRFTESAIAPELRAKARGVLAEAQAQGHIAILIAGDTPPAVMIFGDVLRPGAAALIKSLHAMNVRPIVMLSGDNRTTAGHIAQSIGLDAFHAELAPQDKVTHLDTLRQAHGAVMLVGDGVNDAPGLAAADVSMAMGRLGSQVAMESADIVLVRENVALIPWALGLARAARRTVIINLSLAIGLIVLMAIGVLAASASGHPLPLWLGVVGHEGGTLLVVGHSLLLLRFPSAASASAIEVDGPKSMS